MQHGANDGSTVQRRSRWDSFLLIIREQCGRCFSRRRSYHEEKEPGLSSPGSGSPTSKASRQASKDSLPDQLIKDDDFQFEEPARRSSLVDALVDRWSQDEENEDEYFPEAQADRDGLQHGHGDLKYQADASVERTLANSEVGTRSPTSEGNLTARGTAPSNLQTSKNYFRSASSSDADPDPDPERDPEGGNESRGSPERMRGTDLVLIPEGSIAEVPSLSIKSFNGLEPLELVSESSDVSPQSLQAESRSPMRTKETTEHTSQDKSLTTSTPRSITNTNSGSWDAFRRGMTRRMRGESSVNTPPTQINRSSLASTMLTSSTFSNEASASKKGTPPTTPNSQPKHKDVQSSSHALAVVAVSSGENSDVASTMTPDPGGANTETPSGTSTPRKTVLGDTALPVISELPSEASADSLLLRDMKNHADQQHTEIIVDSSPAKDIDLMSERSSNKSRKLSFLPSMTKQRHLFGRGRTPSVDTPKDFEAQESSGSTTKRRSKEETWRGASSSGYASPASGYATPRTVAAILLGGAYRSKTRVPEPVVDEHVTGHSEASPETVPVPLGASTETASMKTEDSSPSQLQGVHSQNSDELLSGIFLEEAPAPCREERISSSVRDCSVNYVNDRQQSIAGDDTPGDETEGGNGSFATGQIATNEISESVAKHVVSADLSLDQTVSPNDPLPDSNSTRRLTLPLETVSDADEVASLSESNSCVIDEISAVLEMHQEEKSEDLDLVVPCVASAENCHKSRRVSEVREYWKALDAVVVKAPEPLQLNEQDKSDLIEVSPSIVAATTCLQESTQPPANPPVPDLVPQPHLKAFEISSSPLQSEYFESSPPLPVALMMSPQLRTMFSSMGLDVHKLQPETACSAYETETRQRHEPDIQNFRQARECVPTYISNAPLCGLDALLSAQDEASASSLPATHLAPKSDQGLTWPSSDRDSNHDERLDQILPFTVDGEQEQSFIMHHGMLSSSNVSDAGSDVPSIHLKLHNRGHRAPSSKVDSYSDMSRGYQGSSCSANVSDADASSNAPSVHLRLHSLASGRWHPAHNSRAINLRHGAHSSDRGMARLGTAQKRRGTSRRSHSRDSLYADAVDCLSLQMGVSDTRKNDTDAVLNWARS